MYKIPSAIHAGIEAKATYPNTPKGPSSPPMVAAKADMGIRKTPRMYAVMRLRRKVFCSATVKRIPQGHATKKSMPICKKSVPIWLMWKPKPSEPDHISMPKRSTNNTRTEMGSQIESKSVLTIGCVGN